MPQAPASPAGAAQGGPTLRTSHHAVPTAVSSQGDAPAAAARSEQELSPEELTMLRELQARDREVRAHEQAHVSAGGQAVSGGIRYSYQTGPDGKEYAVGGEVSIDTAPVPGDPDATLEKARTVRQAALAPASPSPQDQQVAARAAQLEADARLEKQEQERDGEQGSVTPQAGIEAKEPERVPPASGDEEPDTAVLQTRLRRASARYAREQVGGEAPYGGGQGTSAWGLWA